MSTEEYIAALLRERAGYLQDKNEDRLADVNAELERLGYKEPKAEEEYETAVEAPNADAETAVTRQLRKAKK